MKIFLILTIISLVLLLVRCTKYSDNPYIIKKGNHKSFFGIKRVKPDLKFSFAFTDEHRYLHEVQTTQINKLYGLTSVKIHDNSARFGWRELPSGDFEVLIYYYIDGTRKHQQLCLVKLNEMLHFNVSTDGYNWSFNCMNSNGMHGISIVNDIKLHYLTYPYFGGTIPAPHDMNFKIKKL